MNCIIIEDQPPAQRILKKYIADIGTLELNATFSNAIQAMDFLKTESIDLIFLDIHLPKISGIDFLKTISNPPQVILTTAFPEYALESYELNVVDYLLKPFSFQRFVKAIAKVSTKNKASSITVGAIRPEQSIPNEIFIKSGYEHIKVTISEIIYLKSDTDYTEIFTADKKVLSAEPLRYWEEHLQGDLFVRVHKSFIVNTAKIKKFAGNQIYLTQEIVIPIGRAYKDQFLKRIIR